MKNVEFKTGRRILSAIVASAMTYAMVSIPVLANELIDITSYQLDFSDKFNYSNWGILGETITSDTFIPDSRASFLFPKSGSKVDTFKLNDEISFKFDTATYSANVNNYYKVGVGETAVFTGHNSFVKDVYMGIALYGQSSGDIPFVITYTDGTEEMQTIYIKNKTQLNDAAVGSLPPNYVGAMDISKGHLGSSKYKKTKNDNGVVGSASSSDGLAFYKIDVDETKTIADISVTNPGSIQVGFYAVGGTVMSNAELEELLVIFEEEITGAYDVNADNAKAALAATAAALELYRRGYYIDEESLAMVYEVRSAALVYLADGEVLSFEPSFAVADTTIDAKVVMSNTTQNDVPYVFIVTAYDKENELVGIKATKNKILAKGSVAVIDRVSMDIPDTAVSYKAMVWRSSSLIQPYAVSEIR